MADLEDIRRALAANLRTVLPADEGHVGAYFQEETKIPCLQILGVTEIERVDFEGGKRIELAVEAVLGRVADRASQKRLDAWLESNAVDTALELPLTSRLEDDGSILEDQEPAAGSPTFLRYGGMARLERAGAPLLIATWFVEVWT